MFNLDSSEPVVGKASILMKCSPAEAFKYLGEDFFTNYPKWSPEVKELERINPGPVRVGTLARQVRIDKGYCSESRFRITVYEPGKRLAFVGISEPFRCVYELQHDNRVKSARLSFTFELLELKVFMRPFEQLIRTAVQEGAERIVKNIKRLVEADQSTVN
ncbi:MAG: SRPBCC family protein [Nitrosospira sp.]